MEIAQYKNYSRIECMHQRKLTFVIILLCLFVPISEAKKRCKPLLAKLHNIQAMQRNGYSAKRGLSLRDREDKARVKWWQCENSSGKSKKKAKKKNQKNTVVTNTGINNRKRKTINAGTPFKTSNAIVIKSKYHGDKKQAWLVFYQQPIHCQRPKNLSVFAACSENKQSQRLAFEQQYQVDD